MNGPRYLIIAIFLSAVSLLGGMWISASATLAQPLVDPAAGAAPAKVDQAYLGEWTFTEKDENGQSKGTATATILNFDGTHYFVEWKEGQENPTRYNGVFVTVKDATFAELSPLGNDISPTHLTMRVQMDGTKLKMRQLKKEFFDGVNTDEALRAKVEQNLNNDAMYDGPWLAGSLTSQP
jgi:hypothetical protein